MPNIPHHANPKLADLLAALENVEETSDGWSAKCPVHEDRKNSLSISVGTDGTALVHCHAGCRTPLIVTHCGLTMSELFPGHGKSKSSAAEGRIVATYDYEDEHGNLLFQVCRIEPGKDGAKKDFRQRKPDGKGGFTWKTKGLRKVLYRLPELLKADPECFCFLAEGEKDVDNLWNIGCIATTNPGGADVNGSKWLKTFSSLLKGRHVVILPDNDKVGRGHAAAVADRLKDVAESVRVLELPGLPEKGDVSDWIAAGGTSEQLVALAAAVRLGDLPPTQQATAKAVAQEIVQKAAENPNDPALTHYELKLCNDLELDVLGYVDDEKVKVWSRFHRKAVILKVSKLNYSAILKLCGPVAKAKVARGKEVDEEKGEEYTVSQVHAAIDLLAGYRLITDDTEVGIGCWEGMDQQGHSTPAVVLVGSKEAAVLNETGTLGRLVSPQYEGRMMDLSAEGPWFNFERLDEHLRNYSKDWAIGVLDEAVTLFNRWVWANQAVAPQIIVGCVLASFVQTLWKWRPHIVVLGESNTGKSMFFETLGGAGDSVGIFGRLAAASGQGSVAGVRQQIQKTAAIPVLDEFDSTKEKQEMLDMIRGASRGGVKVLGTQNQKGRKFTLRHIFWIAGISVEFQRAPDKNRFIVLDLLPPAEENAGKLTLPPSDQLVELGEKLLAVAIKNVFRASELSVALKATKIPGIERRVIECCSVPAAMLSTVRELDLEKTVSVLSDMVEESRDREQGEKDHDTLLESILATAIVIPGGRTMSIAQILMLHPNDPEHGATFWSSAVDAMSAAGVCRAYGQRGPRSNAAGEVFLFIASKFRQRLKGTPWESQDIKTILGRAPGAESVGKGSKRRCAGTLQKGVSIPWSYLAKFEIGEPPPEPKKEQQEQFGD